MATGPFGNRIISASEIEAMHGSGGTPSFAQPAVARAIDPRPTSVFADDGPYPLTQKPLVAFGGSISRLKDAEFSPYNYSKIRDLYSDDESVLYTDYDESYRTNPFAHMLVDYMVSRIFSDGYHFEGPGAQVVERFMDMDNTRQKLEMQYKDGILFGNGFLDLYTKGKNGPLVKTRVILPSNMNVVLDTDPKSKTYGDRIYRQGGVLEPLDPTHLFHFMPCEQNGRALGLSILRANIAFLQALLDAGGDTFAALKRVAFAPLIAKLDLDSIANQAEKQQVIDGWIEKMREVESSTNNFAIDKRNDINLVGVGSAGGKLLPVNDLIEPWIAICLRNFGFPIGLFLQSGANKSIVDAQREDVRAFFNSFRRKFKHDIETQLLVKITGRDTHMVWDKPPPSSPETQEEMKTLALLFQLGAISKEYLLDSFDIEDTGKTFYEGNLTQGSSHDLGGNPGNKGA